MTDPPHLDRVFASLLSRREEQGRRRRLTLRRPGAVDFSSNGYLSLATDPDIRAAYISRLSNDGDTEFSLGSSGSRLLDGNSPAAERLEADIAAFHGARAGLLFNSGFEANTGLFGCAPQKGDVVVYDELIHASVHDGMKLGRARTIPFAHNCVADNEGTNSKHQSLDAILSQIASESASSNVFVAVEAVYSMDGDIAPLREIVECVERRLPRGNGYVIVDEAHSTGWIGRRGRGLVCQLGLEDRVWARVHTFGKAMGCTGAIVLCTPTTRSYMINYARSLIYTTAMGYPSLAAIKTSYEYLSLGRGEDLIRNLQSLMHEAHGLLLSVSRRCNPPPQLFHINAAPPESPIIPLFSSQSRSLAQHCQQRGYMVRPIVAPTVPKGTDRVRLCLHAANTSAELQGLCAAIEEWLQEKMAGEYRTESQVVKFQPPPSESLRATSLAELSKL